MPNNFYMSESPNKEPAETEDGIVREEVAEVVEEALRIHAQHEGKVRVADVLETAGVMGVSKAEMEEAFHKIEAKHHHKMELGLFWKSVLVGVMCLAVLILNVVFYMVGLHLLNSPSDIGHTLGMLSFLALVGMNLLSPVFVKKVILNRK